MRSTVLSRRSFAIAAVSLVAALGLAACGTQNPPSASSTGAGGTTDTGPTLSSGDVTLRVNWWGGDARVEGTNQAIEAFQAKYPNIHVTGELSDWNGYWDKLATSVAGGARRLLPVGGRLDEVRRRGVGLPSGRGRLGRPRPIGHRYRQAGALIHPGHSDHGVLRRGGRRQVLSCADPDRRREQGALRVPEAGHVLGRLGEE